MKQWLAILLLSCIFSFSQAQEYKKLQKAAALASEEGNFPKAIELSELALKQALKDKKAPPADLLGLRSEQAAYYLLNEQIDKGVALFGDLIGEVADGKSPAAEMSICQNYGVALVFLGLHTEALPLLQKAVDMSKTHTMKAEDLISCLGALAVCYQYQYSFLRAEELFREAEALCNREGMVNTADYATLQSNFALLYRDMQLPLKASACYKKAEKAFHKSKDTLNPQYPVFLLEYGSMLAESFQFDRALNLTYRARNIDRQLYSENSSAYAGDLNNLGYIYSRMNRIVETEQFYTQALRIKKGLSFLRLDSYLTTLSNLMVFYASVGRDQEAMEMAAEMEEALKNKALTDTLKRATFASNLGVLYKGWGDQARSLKYFRDALLYYEAVYGPDNLFMAEVYMDMGTVFFAYDNFNETNTQLRKAADIYAKTPVEEHPGFIGMLCNLAVILKEIGQAREADTYMNKALELTRKFAVTQPDILEQVYISKAGIAADLKDVRTATEYFHKYLDLKYEQVEQNFSYMTEHEKMFFLEEFENNIKNFYATILSNMEQYPGLIKALLDFRLRTKAMLLNNLSKIRQKIGELNDPVLLEKFEELKLKRETAAKLMSFNTDDYPDALAEASVIKGEADLLEKEVSLQVSGSFPGEADRQNSWKKIQKLLGPDEAAIEIFQCHLVYDQQQGKGTNYTYMIIFPSGDPVALAIDRPLSWEDEVLELYRNSIEFRKDNPDLYRRLWQAVDEKLSGVSTVYLSPDGIYNQINLNTLYNPRKQKYLIEEKNFHLLTTLNDLKQIKQSTFRKPASCVLVGNPRFDYDITRLNSPQKQPEAVALASRGAFGFVLSELPGTKEEVEVIRDLFGKSGVSCQVFTEEAANERDIKKIRNPDVLHIATHGFFLEDPKDEDLAGYDKLEKEFYKNPMMRSGIFFSGANKNYALNTSNASGISDFEDGMLTSYEAMNLALDKTELVVLSACQTGLGKVKNGEGVYGLQRAFKLAGARSVIMSLWPVSDEATKDLMIALYEGWMKTGDLYKAFKDAQLEVRKKSPDPFFWGAFVLIGK
jgi:CHAT domain-containing protein